MMSTKEWIRTKTEEGQDLKLMQVRYDYYKSPRGDKELKLIVLISKDACNVIPITKEGKIVMIKQFRFGTREWTLEIPGGLVDEGEELLKAAKRELLEETGYASGDWAYLGKVPSNPVFMEGDIHHWIAKGVELKSVQQLDEAEDIEVMALTLNEVKIAVQTGEISHPHTLSALCRVFNIFEV